MQEAVSLHLGVFENQLRLYRHDCQYIVEFIWFNFQQIILIVANLRNATSNIVPVTEMLVFTFQFFLLVSTFCVPHIVPEIKISSNNMQSYISAPPCMKANPQLAHGLSHVHDLIPFLQYFDPCLLSRFSCQYTLWKYRPWMPFQLWFTYLWIYLDVIRQHAGLCHHVPMHVGDVVV